MNKIKFSHYYPKLPENCRKAKLLDLFVTDCETLSEPFIEYDTKYYDGEDKHYPLPKGKVMVLLFLAVDGTLFTTIRRSTGSKLKYYLDLIGKDFEMVIA